MVSLKFCDGLRWSHRVIHSTFVSTLVHSQWVGLTGTALLRHTVPADFDPSTNCGISTDSLKANTTSTLRRFPPRPNYTSPHQKQSAFCEAPPSAEMFFSRKKPKRNATRPLLPWAKRLLRDLRHLPGIHVADGGLHPKPGSTRGNLMIAETPPRRNPEVYTESSACL